MYSLYIIKSVASDRYYVGSAEDPIQRLAQHNAGKVRSTKAYMPYILVHTESYATLAAARTQEMKVKRSGHVERYLKNFTALSSNG